MTNSRCLVDNPAAEKVEQVSHKKSVGRGYQSREISDGALLTMGNSKGNLWYEMEITCHPTNHLLLSLNVFHSNWYSAAGHSPRVLS